MADNLDKPTRSKIMKSIKSGNTLPEQLLRKGLFALGCRYRLRQKPEGVKCTPDLLIKSRKICIFVDGCFWHGCPRCFRAPTSNKRYWGPKIKKNIERDKRQTAELKRNGWKVIRVWEHDLKADLPRTIKKVRTEMKGRNHG